MTNKAQKEKTNKTLSMYNFVIVLLILIITISSCIGIFAWAKYTSATDGTATAQVAKWSFKLVDGVTETTDVIDFAITRTDGYGKVVEGLLAPGTFGEFQIGIDARGTETILEYTIDVELENKPTYLKFYKDAEKTQEISVIDNKLTLDGYMSLEDVKEIRTETIYWDWPYENGDDVTDTNDSGKLVTMQVSVTGYEVLEPLLDQSEWEFYYTGQMEKFVVPATATYQLEVYGAQGGDMGKAMNSAATSGLGGKGGYSIGNVKLQKGTILYVGVGGQGTTPAISASNAGTQQTAVGGFNGGGYSTGAYPVSGTLGAGGSGGGATHIGTFNSTLEEHGSTDGLYIVAGGGGRSSYNIGMASSKL